MPRKWTAANAPSFDPGGVVSADGVTVPSLSRATGSPGDATRHSLRLFVGYTLLLLPLHCGVCWFASRSFGLAAASVLVIAAGLLAVAFAKWLKLDDLLQKLPLLIALSLGGIGIAYLSTQTFPRGIVPGAEYIGVVLIAVMLVSVLSSLYRPLADAYQTVTLKTHVRDLAAAAGAMLASLAVVAAAQAVPRFVLEILAFGVSGGCAGLVVIEYAAWARANPSVALERVVAFERACGRNPTGDARQDPIRPAAAVLWAAIFGASCGAFVVGVQNARSLTPEFRKFLLALADHDQEKALDVFGMVIAVGLAGAIFGFLRTGAALGAVCPRSPVRTARLAYDALTLFLSYPAVSHPLVHRIRVKWLRPPAARVTLTWLVLITSVTAIYASVERRPEPAPPKPQSSPRSEWPPQPSPAPYPAHLDRDSLRMSGQTQWGWSGPPAGAPLDVPPVQPDPPAPAANPAGGGLPSFLALVFALVAGPPLLLGVMLYLLGLHVLPTYASYFETPHTTA